MEGEVVTVYHTLENSRVYHEKELDSLEFGLEVRLLSGEQCTCSGETHRHLRYLIVLDFFKSLKHLQKFYENMLGKRLEVSVVFTVIPNSFPILTNQSEIARTLRKLSRQLGYVVSLSNNAAEELGFVISRRREGSFLLRPIEVKEFESGC